MANQMIALQARVPQAPDIGGLAARYGNMMAQQRTSERQAAVAQQQMEFARSGEERAIAADARDAEMAKLDRNSKIAALLKSDLGMIRAGDVAAISAWTENAKRMMPDWAPYIPPAEQIANDRNTQLRMAGTIEQIINKEIATPTASVGYDKQGNASNLVAGGLNPGATPLIVGGTGGNANAAPTSAAPAVAASPEQLGAAAQFMLNNSNASISDPALRGLSPEDMTRAQGLADQMRSGGTMQPISMNTGGQMAGGQGQPDMGAIVQDMLKTGVISQSNMNTLNQLAGPQKAQQLAQIMQANNFRVMPDEQAAPAGMRNTVLRSGEGAPAQMQLASTNEVGTQFQGVDPTMGRYPGSARVPIPRIREEAEAKLPPISRVREEAVAGRETKEEIGGKERAKAQAQADVEFTERYLSDRETSENIIKLIDKMVGDTYVKDGKLYVKKGGRQPAPGFEDVIGATWRPGYRFISGTDAADFDAMQEQVEGQAFLEAFERLKGGGSITVEEGLKGTRAISRMKRTISEKAYVEAARELQGIIRAAMARGESRYNRLQGRPSTPANPQTRKPAASSSGWGKAKVVGD